MMVKPQREVDKHNMFLINIFSGKEIVKETEVGGLE
jgi:hypothetical protein